MRAAAVGLAVLWSFVCAAAPPRPQQGSAVAVDLRSGATWVVDAERGALQRLGADGAAQELPVGAWPEQVVVDGSGRAWASVRGDGAVAVVEGGSRLAVPLPGEPRGLLLDEARRRLYVGLVTAQEVVALDLDSRAVVARQRLPRAPWALEAVGGELAVLPRQGGVVYFVDPCLCRRGVDALPLPTGREPRPEDPQPAPVHFDFGTVDATGRPLPVPEPDVAWNGQALAADGQTLYVAYHVLNTGGGSPPNAGYGRDWRPIGSAVARIQRRGEGPGRGRVAEPWAREANEYLPLPLADITSALAADGVLYLTSRGTGAVVAFELATLPRRSPESASHALGDGLTGLALSAQGELLTLAAFDRAVLRLERHPAAAKSLSRYGEDQRQLAPWWGVVREQTHWGKGRRTAPRVLRERARVALPASALDAELALGRRLFHAAIDSRVTASGLSCVSCHVDGRTDGLVWRVDGARRQTPVLTGRLDSAPFGWGGEHATLDASLQSTLKRIRGRGLPPAERAALARYLREGLPPVSLPPPADGGLVARGKALFEDDAVGCASCHPSNPRGTDGVRHDVGSLSKAEREEQAAASWVKRARPRELDTPSLRHLAISAPYFHDGASGTLAQLVAKNRDRMGNTSQLSPEDRAALVAYLETL